MKKCPTCDKTFEDSMRFCQTDGTPLVDEAPAFDPYATVVARPEETPVPEPISEPVPEERIEVSLSAVNEPEVVLDLPEQSDPLTTMYVSEDEMRKALGASDDSEEPIMDIPPIAEPEAPTFAEPEIPAPIFGDITPPASPFAMTESTSEETPVDAESAFQSTNPPIPEPFELPIPAAFEPPPAESETSESETVIQPPPSPFQAAEPAFSPTPEPPPFKEPEPAAPAFGSPFEEASAPAEWTPPPAPEASWQNQEIGQNTPFQPPPAGSGGLNQTLPIVCLVLGIVSICCYISPLTGLGALITGYLSMKNIKNDPANYGGKGLAIAGMIVGGIFFAIGLAYYIFVILVYAGIFAGSILQGY